LQARGDETSLIKYIARKEWWHVPPRDPEAYQKRGKFYSSTFREAEFYGRPGDPERVTVQNPLVGDEATVEQTLFRRRYSESFNDMGGARLIKARLGLDAKIKAAALKKGFDAVVLMAPSGFAEYLRSGKIPRSLELNILTPERCESERGDQAE